MHNSIQAHQAEDFGSLEVLVNIIWPHEGHLIRALLGPSSAASVGD